MRIKCFIVIAFMLLLVSCKKDYLTRCQVIKVGIEIPTGMQVDIVTNIEREIYCVGSEEWVMTFEDYVALEKERVKDPYIAFYDQTTYNLIRMEPLENCICHKQQIREMGEPERYRSNRRQLFFYLRLPGLDYSKDVFDK